MHNVIYHETSMHSTIILDAEHRWITSDHRAGTSLLSVGCECVLWLADSLYVCPAIGWLCVGGRSDSQISESLWLAVCLQVWCDWLTMCTVIGCSPPWVLHFYGNVQEKYSHEFRPSCASQYVRSRFVLKVIGSSFPRHETGLDNGNSRNVQAKSHFSCWIQAEAPCWVLWYASHRQSFTRWITNPTLGGRSDGQTMRWVRGYQPRVENRCAIPQNSTTDWGKILPISLASMPHYERPCTVDTRLIAY